jgi:hypothetical protein
MANFAKINGDLVTEVIVIANSNCDDLVFPDSEPVGQAYIASLGLDGEWLQTSYIGAYRGCFAGIGYTWDAVNEIFVAPPSNPAPVPMPKTKK